MVTDKRHRRPRRRAAPAPGRPADPLLARQYVTIGNPAPTFRPRLFHFQRPAPGWRTGAAVARADGGVTSNWIHDQLAVGESVKISGAYGTFIGDPGGSIPRCCAAAGTGLAPILALAEAALRRGFRAGHPAGLLGPHQEDVYSLGMMAWWRTKHRNFDYKITLTREKAAGSYQTGRIDGAAALFPDLSNTAFSPPAARPLWIPASRRQEAPWRPCPSYPYEGFFQPADRPQADAEHDPWWLPF